MYNYVFVVNFHKYEARIVYGSKYFNMLARCSEFVYFVSVNISSVQVSLTACPLLCPMDL